MARPRKTARELALTGQWRPDRHAGRRPPAPRRSTAAPPIPQWLKDPSARALWRHLAPLLYRTKLADPADQTALAVMCDWYAKYRDASLESDRARSPESKRLALLTAATAWTKAAELMAKFGLTPRDRAHLETREHDEPDPAELRFFSGAG